MIVYRIEDRRELVGPYWNGDMHHEPSMEHPPPTRDFCVECEGGTMSDELRRRQEADEDYPWASEHIYGFHNERQIVEWFTPFELSELARVGYRLTVMHGGKVILGRKQASIAGGSRLWSAPLRQALGVLAHA